MDAYDLSESSCSDLFEIMVLPYLQPNVRRRIQNRRNRDTNNALAIGSTVSHSAIRCSEMRLMRSGGASDVENEECMGRITFG